VKNLTSSSAPPPVRDEKGKGKGGRKGTRREEPEEDRYDSEPLEYREFRLQIGRGKAGGFEVEVQDAPAGRARAEVSLPLDAATVERHLKGLWDLRKDRHERDLAEEVDATIGSKLFAAALGGDVLRSFENSVNGLRGVAAGGVTYGLRIRLLVGSPAAGTPLDQDAALAEELLRVGSQPWEYLYNARAGRLLGRLACDRRTPVVRSLDTPYFLPPLAVDGPLRILVVDCVPEDQRPLETEKERRQLRSAIENTDVARVVPLTDPTISELRNKLLRINPHILHFIGHGGFDRDLGDGYLCLVGDDNKTDRLRADELGQMLAAVSNLRLVFLNSCRTAQFPRHNGQDPWSATAAAILRAGIPSVIAMQFPISDPAAVAFSTGFYRALREGDPLEAAVVEGRIEIQRCSPWEWGIPVLYLNAEKGQLFVPKAGAAAPSWREDPEAPEPLKLGIRSFIGWGADMKARVDQMLALDSYFDGRFIREPELWSERVAPKLSRFLKRWVKGDRPVELEMAAHQTLAFLTGYLLEAKGGIRLTLIQRSQGLEPQSWTMDEGEIPPGPLWTVEESHLSSPEGDVAVAIGVTRPVFGDVEDYLRSNGIPVGRLISLSLPGGFGQKAVKSGAHAAALAQDLANLLDARSPAQKRRTLHILGSAPNAFFLYLGSKARGFGEIQLYEYDLEKTGHKSYQPSLRLPLTKT
jgi:SMODS-associated and fused to various effectors sensor domain/CHAT domain